MNDGMLDYYENELLFLRDEGKRFAEKYPKIAGQLQLETDPHVNRLLQGFALLAARVHRKIDDDFPEICQALLELVSPGYLRPVPSMTIVEFLPDPKQGRQTVGQCIERKTELTTKETVNGLPCRFSTAYDVTLWPFYVAEAGWSQPERMKRPVRASSGEFAAGAVRLLLRCHPDVQFKGLPIKTIRMHLAAGSNAGSGMVYSLYELLADRCFEIQLRDPRDESRTIPLPASNLKPVGFSPDKEALLPFGRRSVDGHRLLEEYFVFPEKFLFFDLEGLEPLNEAGFGEEAEIVFLLRAFDRPERQQSLESGVNAATFRLGCTPAINLFSVKVESIQLSQVRHEYPIVTASNPNHRAYMEVFGIEEVIATQKRLRLGTYTKLEPLLAYRYQSRNSKDRAFWIARRRFDAAEERNPSTMGISVVDLDGAFTDPDGDTLDIQALCSNHSLPAHPKMPWSSSSGDFEPAGCATANRVTVLSRPTPTLPAHSQDSYLWRLISMMSLNFLSLAEGGLPALQEILRLHNRSGSIANENQVGALENLRSEFGFALVDSEYGLIPARGTKVTLEFDEQQFAGAGLYLFTSILDRFLGGYTSMNSFSQMTVFARKEQRKEAVAKWPPRSGNQALL